jgi:hypothetical protein
MQKSAMIKGIFGVKIVFMILNFPFSARESRVYGE